MPEPFYDMLTYALEKEIGLTQTKARSLASCFVGIEDFLSEDSEYSSQLFEVLRKLARQILHQRSISSEIETCAKRLTDDFIQEYGEGEQGISNYIESIF